MLTYRGGPSVVGVQSENEVGLLQKSSLGLQDSGRDVALALSVTDTSDVGSITVALGEDVIRDIGSATVALGEGVSSKLGVAIVMVIVVALWVVW